MKKFIYEVSLRDIYAVDEEETFWLYATLEKAINACQSYDDRRVDANWVARKVKEYGSVRVLRNELSGFDRELWIFKRELR